jgi:hypothetical protein
VVVVMVVVVVEGIGQVIVVGASVAGGVEVVGA